MTRRIVKLGKELLAAIDLQNIANKAAKVQSRKPRRVMRLEANAVRRELKHDAGMTTKLRSRAEQLRQVNLAIKREQLGLRARVGAILAGLPAEENKTELGIVLPSGADIGKVLTRVRE